jgi:hypothetical protein
MNRQSYLMDISRAAAARFIRVGRGSARRAAGRVMFLGSLVCAASVMCAPDALAQTAMKSKSMNKDYTVTVQSPCTNEGVNIDGKQFVQSQSQQNGSTTRTTFKVNTSGKGVGQVSTAQYQYQDMAAQNSTIDSTSPNFYFRQTFRTHLIRNGAQPPIPDDWFARSVLLIRVTNGQVDPTVESFNADGCK